mmetsp:Transcript_84468/g.219842  ORF Transcript_84468/g.219842 Transcript_84468/m.219842 type:complete len:463 (+) Transcript_84468:28-1416(+)
MQKGIPNSDRLSMALQHSDSAPAMPQRLCAAGMVITSGQKKSLSDQMQARAIAFMVCRAAYDAIAGSVAVAALKAVPKSVQVQAQAVDGAVAPSGLPNSLTTPTPVIDAVTRALDPTEVGGDTAQGLPSESSAHKFLITPQMDDELERQGVSSDLLEVWHAKELKAYPCASCQDAALKHPPQPRVPPMARDLALRFMQYLVQLVNLPSKSWFEAQVLLDVYMARAPPSFGVHALPATCVVVVKLVKKMENAVVTKECARVWAANAKSAASTFRKSGFDVPDPTEQQLLHQELAVLQAVGWQIYFPTVESWMLAFCTRFNVITQGIFAASLAWIWKQSQFFRMTVVTREASCSALPPRKVAAGLLGLRFFSARLLPIRSLQPEELSDATWQRLVATAHGECRGSPSCAFTAEIVQRVLESLQAATGFTLDELREATKHVASILMGVFEDLQSAQQQQQEEEDW